jgi:hypothetical protein
MRLLDLNPSPERARRSGRHRVDEAGLGETTQPQQFDTHAAEELRRSLRTAPLLTGNRGSPTVSR